MSLRQRVYGSCSRWRVKCSSLRLGLALQEEEEEEEVTGRSSLCLQPGRWRAGAGPAILCGKIFSDWARAGHLQLQAFSSLQPNAETLRENQRKCLWWSSSEEGDASNYWALRESKVFHFHFWLQFPSRCQKRQSIKHLIQEVKLIKFKHTNNNHEIFGAFRALNDWKNKNLDIQIVFNPHSHKKR